MLNVGAYARFVRRMLRVPRWMLFVAVFALFVAWQLLSIPTYNNNKTLLDALDYDADTFENGLGIAEKEESRMASLLESLFDTLAGCKPRFGFELQTGVIDYVGAAKEFKLFQREYTNAMVDVAYHDANSNAAVLSEEYLANGLNVPQALAMDLRISHKRFVAQLHDAPNGLYEGAGYVLIGGGKFTWLSVLSITNLRETGSVLPVELVIPTAEDYESNICEEVLPELGGSCLKLYEVIPPQYVSKVAGYQLKVLALLASSFETVIYLDSDNVPVENPDTILQEGPFVSHGLVLWPDFWRRRHHPAYYQVAGVQLGEVVRNIVDDVSPTERYANPHANLRTEVPLHDREGAIPDLSTESGQLVVNKKIHFKTLMLALYYNYYGPHQYYPLFGQGGAGEGDKDTFYAAANVLHASVYQVHRGLNAVGRFIGEDYVGAAMVQYDPVQDYKNVQAYAQKQSAAYIPMLKYLDDAPNIPMFIHCNFPKLEPSVLTHEKYVASRMYGDKELEFEVAQWKHMYHYFCLAKVDFAFWPLTTSERSTLCADIEARIIFVKEHP